MAARSGVVQSFPEIDRVEWFDLGEARRKLKAAQVPFLDRLQRKLPSALQSLAELSMDEHAHGAAAEVDRRLTVTLPEAAFELVRADHEPCRLDPT